MAGGSVPRVITEQEWTRLINDIRLVRVTLESLAKAIDGRPEEDIVGLRPRMRLVEQAIETADDHIQALLRLQEVALEMRVEIKNLRGEQVVYRETIIKWENRFTGAKWVAGFLGLTNIAALGTLLRFILAGP